MAEHVFPDQVARCRSLSLLSFGGNTKMLGVCIPLVWCRVGKVSLAEIGSWFIAGFQ